MISPTMGNLQITRFEGNRRGGRQGGGQGRRILKSQFGPCIPVGCGERWLSLRCLHSSARQAALREIGSYRKFHLIPSGFTADGIDAIIGRGKPQKIKFGEMRKSGVRGVLIYCSDYHCSHHTTASADSWPDHIRLTDLEPRFVCNGMR